MSRMKNTEKTMDKIVALSKNRGFVFPGRSTADLQTHGITVLSAQSLKIISSVHGGRSSFSRIPTMSGLMRLYL